MVIMRKASPICPLRQIGSRCRKFLADSRAAAAIEAAFVLPIVIAILLGIATFGQWFMIAHTMQQAADEAARAAVAGLNDDDRRAMVTESVNESLAIASGVDAHLVSTATRRSGDYYTVTVTYQTAQNRSLTVGIIPVPIDPIARQSTVKLVTI